MDRSQDRIGLALGVPARRINEIVLGKRGITDDTALRLARYFKMSPQFWFGLQMDYELDLAQDMLKGGLEREVIPMTVAVAVSYILVTLIPLLYPTYVSFRTRQFLPRRLLFVGIVAALSYGIESFFLLAIGLPLEAYAVFVAPPLESSGHPYGYSLVSIAEFIKHWGWLFLPIPPAVVSVVLTRYLVTRWARIVEPLWR